jgi:hypothetical protein
MVVQDKNISNLIDNKYGGNKESNKENNDNDDNNDTPIDFELVNFQSYLNGKEDEFLVWLKNLDDCPRPFYEWYNFFFSHVSV